MKPRISKQSLHRFAIGGAWFFIIISLLTLAGAFLALTSGVHPVALLDVSAGGRTYTAPGLTYSGVAGGALIFFEVALVIAATVATFFKNNMHRRIGHGALIGWAALWLFSSYSLAGVDGEIDILAQTLIMSVLGTCTAYRAFRGWNTPSQLPSLRRKSVDIYQSESDVVAETLPSVDAAIPQDSCGIASDEASASEQPHCVYSQQSSSNKLQNSIDGASRGFHKSWNWSKTAGRKIAELAVSAWRSSNDYLRSRGVLPHTTGKTTT